jgi:hypothetical protein
VLGFVSSALGFLGPVLVQGALVQIVRNIHEGRRPERIRALYREAGGRLPSLFWASIVYGFGVVIGLILLIVPGLLAAARWCLMAPLIMLEGERAGPARRRSSELVRDGHTGSVMGIVVLTYVLLSMPFFAFALANLASGGWVSHYLLSFLWSSVSAPFAAHVLTVIYYRLTDPERPVIHEDVSTWNSVWEAA